MTTKGIVLKRNDKDQPKFDQLNALQPNKVITYANTLGLATAGGDFGSLDYLLVTGGHGDFQSGKPSKFNDATIDDAKKWIKSISGTFKAIILDTCFSSALAASFLPFLPNGGCIVCAHGTGEGWAGAFSTANGKKTVGTVLAAVVNGTSDLFGAISPGSASYSSVSLAIRKPINQLLYTANAGPNRGKGIATRDGVGMEVDTEIELKEVDLYLRRDRIDVVAVSDSELVKLLTDNLTMTVV
ncbi:MAG: hypothetical protein ACREF0_05885 [Acetobacteraceae bacterium]